MNRDDEWHGATKPCALIDLAQFALSLASFSRHTWPRGMLPTGTTRMSYWGAKLVALSMVMSMVITAAAGAGLWLISN
jgi:hypothetical protein